MAAAPGTHNDVTVVSTSCHRFDMPGMRALSGPAEAQPIR